MGNSSRAKDLAEWATLGLLIYGVHARNQAKREAAFEAERFSYADPFVFPDMGRLPRCNKRRVLFTDLVSKSRFRSAEGLILTMGETRDGKPRYLDLEKLPHLLIAGSTGSGKTVLMHDLILSILLKNTPDAAELYLINTKAEFDPYRKLGYCHVESSSSGAAIALTGLCSEMDVRYEIFSRVGVTDLRSYNTANPDNRLPHKIVFIDELADLMLSDSSNRVKQSLIKLSAKARAAGICLIIATQYPTVEIVPGLIKANISARISLSVATRSNSMVILDEPGAEKLEKQGDMYYKNGGSLIRLQAGYVDREVIDFIVGELAKNQYDKAGVLGSLPKGYTPPPKSHPVRNFFIGMVAAIAILVMIGNAITSIRVMNIQAETVGMSHEEIRDMLECGFTADEIITYNEYEQRGY